MTRMRIVVGSVLLFAFSVLPTSAQSPHEGAIKARKAQMQLYAWNLGILGDMAKEKTEYNADAAKAAAASLSALARLDGSSMWPAGSDSTALPDLTRAKAESWTTYPAVVEKQKALLAALDGMNEAAGAGLDSLKGQMKAVADGCGGCHKDFREEKK